MDIRERLRRPVLRSGELIVLLDGYMQDPMGIYAVTPQHRQVSAGKARAFADHVQHCLRALPGWEDGAA